MIDKRQLDNLLLTKFGINSYEEAVEAARLGGQTVPEFLNQHLHEMNGETYGLPPMEQQEADALDAAIEEAKRQVARGEGQWVDSESAQLGIADLQRRRDSYQKRWYRPTPPPPTFDDDRRSNALEEHPEWGVIYTRDPDGKTTISRMNPPKEAEELASDLGAALEPMTAGVFDAFASVTFESASPRHTVSVARDRQIVVARFRGLRQSLDAVGYGGRTLRRDGSIASGTVMLDSEYDLTVGLRRLLRMHELGHALGYNHIASRRSIMNPTLGSDVTEFDRRAALVAFRRK